MLAFMWECSHSLLKGLLFQTPLIHPFTQVQLRGWYHTRSGSQVRALRSILHVRLNLLAHTWREHKYSINIAETRWLCASTWSAPPGIAALLMLEWHPLLVVVIVLIVVEMGTSGLKAALHCFYQKNKFRNCSTNRLFLRLEYNMMVQVQVFRRQTDQHSADW